MNIMNEYYLDVTIAIYGARGGVGAAFVWFGIINFVQHILDTTGLNQFNLVCSMIRF